MAADDGKARAPRADITRSLSFGGPPPSLFDLEKAFPDRKVRRGNHEQGGSWSYRHEVPDAAAPIAAQVDATSRRHKDQVLREVQVGRQVAMH